MSQPTTESPFTVGALGSRGGGLSWLSNSGIIKLNLMLVLLQISSYATGYDGSMMNGLQSLTTWQNSFNNPGASELGLYVINHNPTVWLIIIGLYARTLELT